MWTVCGVHGVRGARCAMQRGTHRGRKARERGEARARMGVCGGRRAVDVGWAADGRVPRVAVGDGGGELGLGVDGGEDPVERGLHANHLALHDLGRRMRKDRVGGGGHTRYWPSRCERRLWEGERADSGGTEDLLDAGRVHRLHILLLRLFKHTSSPAQLTTTTGCLCRAGRVSGPWAAEGKDAYLAFASVFAFSAGGAGPRTSLRDVRRLLLRRAGRHLLRRRGHVASAHREARAAALARRRVVVGGRRGRQRHHGGQRRGAGRGRCGRLSAQYILILLPFAIHVGICPRASHAPSNGVSQTAFYPNILSCLRYCPRPFHLTHLPIRFCEQYMQWWPESFIRRSPVVIAFLVQIFWCAFRQNTTIPEYISDPTFVELHFASTE